MTAAGRRRLVPDPKSGAPKNRISAHAVEGKWCINQVPRLALVRLLDSVDLELFRLRRKGLQSLSPKGIEVHEHRLSVKGLDNQPTGLLVVDLEKRLHLFGHESAQRGEAVSIVLSEPVMRHA